MKSSQKGSFRFSLAGWRVVGLSGTQGREELYVIIVVARWRWDRIGVQVADLASP